MNAVHWTGTVDRMHVNGVYIITTEKEEKFLISLSQLSRGTAIQYTQQILEALSLLAQSYSEYNGQTTGIKL